MPPALSDYDSDGYEILETTEREDYAATRVERLPVEPKVIIHQDQRSSTGSVTDRGSRNSVSRPLRSDCTLQLIDVKHREPNSKKRHSLLAGLDLDNIITACTEEGTATEDTSPVLSTTMSQKLRPHRSSAQKSELCYDQAYHPMDDYVAPKRAVKIKSKYDLEELDNASSGASIDIDDIEEVDTDVEQVSVKRKGRQAPRRSSAQSPITQPTRRSSRKTNKDIIYDSKIHPQDEELDGLEDGVGLRYLDIMSRKRSKLHASEAEEEETVEQEVLDTDNEGIEEVPVEELPDSDDDPESDILTGTRSRESSNEPSTSNCIMPPPPHLGPQDSQYPSSYPGSSSLHARSRSFSTGITPPRAAATRSSCLLVTRGEHLDTDIHMDAWPKVRGAPFTIYHEPVQVQEAALALPPPVLYFGRREEEDKENRELDEELQVPSDPYDGIEVRGSLSFHIQTILHDHSMDAVEFAHFEEAMRTDDLGTSVLDGADLSLSNENLSNSETI